MFISNLTQSGDVSCCLFTWWWLLLRPEWIFESPRKRLNKHTGRGGFSACGFCR